MAAWAATAIRQHERDTKLYWAVESRCAPVIDTQSLVTELALFPRDRWKRNRWSPTTWKEQVLGFTRLRKLRLDVGFDLQGHSKTALCLRLANPSRRFSARATDALAVRLNPPVGQRPPDTHTVEWNHHVIRQFDNYAQPDRPLMPYLNSERDARLVTISVSAGQPEKSYPAKDWAEVAGSLIKDGLRVAFLGGPSDAPIELAGTEDFVGKLPLADTMQMVATSALHLAADTGTGHMAAAYGVPVVSVFSTMNPNEYRPYTNLGIVLREGSDPSAVSPAAVLAAARSLLASAVPD